VDLTPRDRSLLTVTMVLLLVFLAFQVATAFLGALARVADVLLIFLVAWAVSYLLVPLVDLVDRRTLLDRTGAVAVVYLAIAIVFGIVLALGIPVLASQLAALTERGPEFGDKASQVVVDWQQSLQRAGIRVDLGALYGAIPERLGGAIGAVAGDALGVVAATGALLFDATLVLIISFFMLVDGERLWERSLNALSPALRSEAELLRQAADRSFGGFLRASLILGTVYGIAQFLILAPFGVPFAGIIALSAGLVMVIPFFGPIIAIVPVIVATVLGAPGSLLWVFLLTLLLQQITLNLIGPRLMSEVIGIHPLFVFLAILLGARLAGFWGVLLAMPVAGIGNTFARYIYEVARGRRMRTEAHLIAEVEPPEPREITVATR
jgi:predicted PurR-regulated permease PerM